MSKFLDKQIELDSTPGNTCFMTYSGVAFDIFNPSTWVFDLDDIAQALANTCRFGGHVQFYSVAEHCVRVAGWLQDRGESVQTQLIGLLHDAVEAYIGDIIRPIKKTFVLEGESIMDLEKGMEYALFQAFGLLDEQFDDRWAVVKQGDMAVFEFERVERPNVGLSLTPAAAKHAFLALYNGLTG